MDNNDSQAVTEWLALNEAMRDWANYEHAFAIRVLANVRLVKKMQKITTATLAQKLRDEGWPTTLNSLNGMLSKKGRATITVTEVIAFGNALEVSPLDLIFGFGDASETVWSDFNYKRVRIRARSLFTGLNQYVATPLTLKDLHSLVREDALALMNTAITEMQTELDNAVSLRRSLSAQSAEFELLDEQPRRVTNGEHPEAS